MRNLTDGEKLRMLSNSYYNHIDEIMFTARAIVLEDMLKNENDVDNEEFCKRVEKWAIKIKTLADNIEVIKEKMIKIKG